MRIDPHIHLGGAIPIDFLWEVIQEYGLSYLAESRDDIVKAVTFAANEQYDFHRFLHKFDLFDQIPWNEELLRLSILAVVRQLQKDNMDYVWLRFSINKYLTFMNWHRVDLIQFIHATFEEFAPGMVGLVLSLKYESPKVAQRQLTNLIHQSEIKQCLVGIDLVGDESVYEPEFYAGLLRPWRDAGKLLFAHVGETRSAFNVMSAIQEVGVTEICHGIRAVNFPEIIEAANQHDVCFHMTITSNLLTKAITTLHEHPVNEFLRRGAKVTMGTDDPVVCSTTLDREFKLLSELLSQRYDYDSDKTSAVIAQLTDMAEERCFKK
jgi:adenosine deaminase